MKTNRLVNDLGTTSDTARAAVPALHAALCQSLDASSASIAAKFDQWTTLFRHATGGDQGLHRQKRFDAFGRLSAICGQYAEEMGIEPRGLDVARWLCSLHTYYALVNKLLGMLVASHCRRDEPSLANATEDLVLEKLCQAERDGGGDDPFGWYVEAWSGEIDVALKMLLARLRTYDVRSLVAVAQTGHDWVRMLYHELVPRPLRHGLGEYYTPAWLAEHVLNEAGYDGRPNQRLLDPSCGSGTFLLAAIRRLCRRWREESPALPRRDLLTAILHNVVGIDLNPLAVVAARTNYLLALGDLLAETDASLAMPIYLADSITMPVRDETCLGRLGQFDVIAGNPPWIGWESLPQAYRAETQPIWVRYGLFPHGGMHTILGHGKKDLSLLMSHVVTDRLLKPGGKLGFVITQSAFKTTGASQGFRRFRLGVKGTSDDGGPVRIERVDDLTDFQSFEDASNRTAVFVWTKGSETTYPVEYRVWQKTTPGKSISPDLSLAEVTAITRRLSFVAEPVSGDDPTSAWITGSPASLRAVRAVIGASDYRAYEGVNTGGANGVYWVEILERRPNGLALIKNIREGARREVDAMTMEIEDELLFPVLRGREVRRWQADGTACVLLAQDPQTRRGIDEEELGRRCPKTLAYLRHFEPTLRERAAFRRYFTRERNGREMETGAFYSMFNVGPYTLAPHKVVWHRMVAPLEAAVVSSRDGKPVLPQETHAFVPCDSAAEAYYIAGLLNSAPFNFAALAYSQAGGKSFGSPHLLENLRVPKFDPSNERHVRVGELAARMPNESSPAELDAAAAAVWGLAAVELSEIRESLGRLLKADLANERIRAAMGSGVQNQKLKSAPQGEF